MIMKKNIGIVTTAIGQANIIPLWNLIAIIKALSDDTYAIVGLYGKNIITPKEKKKERIYKIVHKPGKHILNRILNYTLTQLRISYNLAKLSKNVDLWIFYVSDSLLIPMITAKLLRKKVILAMGGFLEKEIDMRGDPLSKILKLFKKVNLIFCEKIIIYSEDLTKNWNLEKYKNKICIAHEHFLDLDKFKIKKKFDERKNLVGYVGRLSKEKGVLNFVKAISKILKKEEEIIFLVGGDGQLRDEIEKYLDDENLYDKVNLAGWIPHDELPDYLNELKLVVLPSYTEGLPNILLEAMACGTPVLATPIGTIPDIIKDGETGFIMENNNLECVAENVLRALNHPDLEKIVKNARKLAEREFTYGAAVERYRTILKELS